MLARIERVRLRQQQAEGSCRLITGSGEKSAQFRRQFLRRFLGHVVAAV